MTETLILSAAAFAATNLDDLFINTLLFAGAEGRRQRRGILLGKLAATGLLVVLSLAGALGLRALWSGLAGWLGLVPVCLGIRALFSGDDQAETRRGGAGMAVYAAAVTLANGADNLGVYIPLFAGFRGWQIGLAAGVFLVLTLVWCRLGSRLAALPALERLLTRYRRILVPVIYIALGLYLLAKQLL